MLAHLRKFLLSDSGATAIEYALLTALIAVFLIAALQSLGTKLSNTYSEIGNVMK